MSNPFGDADTLAGAVAVDAAPAAAAGESSGIRGVAGTDVKSVPSASSVGEADVKSGAAGGAAGGGAHRSASKHATIDAWRRQSEWRQSQGVVTHKVTVAVEVQNKKPLYKCTFRPLAPGAAAAAAAGAQPAASGPDVTVFRRYDDVIWLRSAVMRLFPGLFFCNLQAKGFMASADEKFHAERRDDTERLLSQMCGVGHGHGLIAQCDPFIQFISAVGVDAFDKVRKDVDARVKARPIDECLKLYTQHFANYMATPLPDKADEQIAEWSVFCKTQDEKIDKCLATATALEATNASLIGTGAKLTAALDAVGKHEDTTKTRCTPARIETQSKLNGWMDCSRLCAAAYGPGLTVNFRRELTDIRAFAEVLSARNDLVKAAASAKATAAKWKKPPAPTDKPLTDKQKTQKEQELKAEIDTDALAIAATKLILSQQSKLFWHEKVALFSKAMALLAQQQIKALDALAPAWKKLSDEASVEPVLISG